MLNLTGKTPMTSLLSSQIMFIFYLLSLSTAFPLTPLLSLNCTPPSNQTLVYNKPIKALLDNLTSEVTKPLFTTSNISFGHGRFTGLMQCRLGLDRTTCIHCARNAKYTISNLCPNSDAITAWFDGCYIQYLHSYGKFSHANLGANNQSCSNQTSAVDRVQFEPALETLLLRLRAEINLVTHHGFSYGELIYANDSKVYGLVECVRSLLPKECEVCVGEAVEKLHEYCGGKVGGTVVAGNCLVRFESYQFFSYMGDSVSDSGGGSDAGGGGSGVVNVWESENSGCMGCKEKLAWACGGGFACLFGVVLLVWFLTRSIVNRAKVDTLGAADDELGSKGID